MEELLSKYWIWIVLAGIFLAMHWFGRFGCGGGHRHGGQSGEETDKSGEGKKLAAQSGSSRGCH